MAKQLSGYAKRKLAKERAEQGDVAENAREAAGFDPTELLTKNMPAKPKGSLGRVVWAQELGQVLIEIVAKDPGMKWENKLRYMQDNLKLIALSHAKAMVEEKLLGLEKNMGVASHQHDDDGLEEDPEAK